MKQRTTSPASVTGRPPSFRRDLRMSSAPGLRRDGAPAPRIRATSVAKYQPPASTSSTRAVRDHARPRPAASRAPRTSPRTRHRASPRSPPTPPARQLAEPARQLVLARAVHATRGLVEADEARHPSRHGPPSRWPAPGAGARRPRGRAGRASANASSPTARRAASPVAPGSSSVTRSRVMKSDGLCVSSAVLRGAATLPRTGSSSPAAARSSVLLPAPLRPISATRSPASTRKPRPRRTSRVTIPSSSSTHRSEASRAGSERSRLNSPPAVTSPPLPRSATAPRA